jgi:cobalt-zinc-cadmium efflux system protein
VRRPQRVSFAPSGTKADSGVEGVGGLRGDSLSLVMDAVHNFSDELALVCLWLAYTMSVKMSRGFQRTANALNSLGLLAISGVVLWQAADRVLHPRPVVGWLPIVAGLVAAAGNWGVARALRPWRSTNPAIALAYLHNRGDVYVSLAPVGAGALVTLLRNPVFDPIVALGVGLWIVGTTAAELRRSASRLLWPEQAVCPHKEPLAAESGG